MSQQAGTQGLLLDRPPLAIRVSSRCTDPNRAGDFFWRLHTTLSFLGRYRSTKFRLDRASYSRILPSPWKDSTHPLIAVRDVAM